MCLTEPQRCRVKLPKVLACSRWVWWCCCECSPGVAGAAPSRPSGRACSITNAAALTSGTVFANRLRHESVCGAINAYVVELFRLFWRALPARSRNRWGNPDHGRNSCCSRSCSCPGDRGCSSGVHSSGYPLHVSSGGGTVDGFGLCPLRRAGGCVGGRSRGGCGGVADGGGCRGYDRVRGVDGIKFGCCGPTVGILTVGVLTVSAFAVGAGGCAFAGAHGVRRSGDR